MARDTRDYVISKVFYHCEDGDESADGRKVQYLTNYHTTGRGYEGDITRVFFGGLWDAMVIPQDDAARVEAFLGAGCCTVLEVGVDIQL